MTYAPFNIIPGVHADDTPTTAQGFLIDSDNIRFVQDKLQVRGGAEYASTGLMLGYCRGMHAWADNATNRYVGMGTDTNVYVYSDAFVYDVTPIIARGEATIGITTASGSSTVTADWTAHGLVAGQAFAWRNSDTASVGGVTIDNAASTITTPSTQYIVATVASANQITYVAAETASSTAGPTNVVVDYYQFLAQGLETTLGGFGYGTGGYGSGDYGSSNSGSLICRKWALANWDQNMLGVPSGGGLFEFSPLFVQTELVTNGDMSTATGWTLGGGWSITGGEAVAIAGSATDLSTSISMTQAAWFAVEFDTSVGAGSFTPYIGSTAIGAAVTASGHYARTFYTGTSPLKFTKDASFAGTLDNVTVKQQINMIQVPNAPTQNTCMLVTPEFICMLFGTEDPSSGLFNPLGIRWSDQFGNPANTGVPLQTWTAATSNQSGFTVIGEGSRIIGAKLGRGEILVWTDSALYSGRYTTDPNIIYRFDLVGVGCGLLGQNAVTVHNGTAFWMSNNGAFYVYAGGAVQVIESTCRRYIYDNLAYVQGEKVYASPISAYNEIQWLYPDQRDGDGVECSRYVKVSVSGNSTAAWDIGTYARTAWVDQGVTEYPFSYGADGYCYFQEKGKSINGAALTWSAKTGPILLGTGATMVQCTAIRPDFDDQAGTITVTPSTYMSAQATPTALSSYSMLAGADTTNFIALGRLIDFNFQGSAAPCFARFGTLNLDIMDTGMIY
jgi:hypothetical protein